MESPVDVDDIRRRLEESGGLYLIDESEEPADEYVRFFFIANYDNGKVLADAGLYTLRMQHESELYELAESRMTELAGRIDLSGKTTDEAEEELGMLMAEIIVGLEEEQAVKVKEHVDLEEVSDSLIALDIGINAQSIGDEEITKFIHAFNEDRLELDPTLYSFQSDDYGSPD
jgi:hypothetical protein